ncbi:MAG: HAD family phosphatase [Rikenellaceae bacterium]
MLKGVKSVVFDIGGVLVDLDFDRCIESFRALGFEGAENLVSCYHPAAFFGELERGEITCEEFYDKIREVGNLPDLSDEQISDAYCSLLVGIPEYKMRLIGQLRKRGFKIYALSNINPVMIDRIRGMMAVDGLSHTDYFDHMFLSFEMGVMKPKREIYERMVESIGDDPSQILFIEDGVQNAEAAREFGINVYLAKANEDFRHIFE